MRPRTENKVTVEAKETSADGVVTLAPARAVGNAAAALGPGRARRPDPGRGADPAVLAVRGPGRPARVPASASCGTRTAAAARCTSTTPGRRRTSVEVRGHATTSRSSTRRRYLFIAGGIGITPILPMIAAAESAGADWQLVYGGRHRASMAFLDELARTATRSRSGPQDEAGLLDLAALLGDPAPDTLVYCCGPEPLLNAVESRCRPGRTAALHMERFAPKPLTEPVRSDAVRGAN